MKGRVILIDMPEERASQAALLVDGRLEDLLLDPLKGNITPAPGEIYWAKIDRLIPKMGGAFVKLTPEHSGFIRGAKGVQEGAGILVQVSCYPDEDKATPVETRILYKGPRIIHTPDAPGVNVSRKIKDPDERERLTSAVVTGIEATEYSVDGFIIRTGAAGAESTEIEREMEWVLAEANTANKRASSPAPLEYVAGSISWAAQASIRDWAFPVPSSVMATSGCFKFLTIADPTLGPVNLWGSNNLLGRIQLFDGPDRAC